MKACLRVCKYAPRNTSQNLQWTQLCVRICVCARADLHVCFELCACAKRPQIATTHCWSDQNDGRALVHEWQNFAWHKNTAKRASKSVLWAFQMWMHVKISGAGGGTHQRVHTNKEREDKGYLQECPGIPRRVWDSQTWFQHWTWLQSPRRVVQRSAPMIWGPASSPWPLVRKSCQLAQRYTFLHAADMLPASFFPTSSASDVLERSAAWLITPGTVHGDLRLTTGVLYHAAENLMGKKIKSVFEPRMSYREILWTSHPLPLNSAATSLPMPEDPPVMMAVLVDIARLHGPTVSVPNIVLPRVNIAMATDKTDLGIHFSPVCRLTRVKHRGSFGGDSQNQIIEQTWRKRERER